MQKGELNILKFPLGQLRANCYIVHHNRSSDCLIIDPGDEADFIVQKLADNDLSPVGIIATHGHFDHIGAVLPLKLSFNAPFYMHEADDFLLKRLRQTQIHFTGTDPGPRPKVDINIKEGDEIKAENISLKVIEVPGHTPGSVALNSEKSEVIFVGDLMFADGSVGRTDFSYANRDTMRKSIRKIEKHHGEAFAGHGDSFDLLE